MTKKDRINFSDSSKSQSQSQSQSEIQNTITNISLSDAIMYILMPGPIVLFYPLLVCMALQNNISNTINRFYLFISSFLVNMMLMPILVPTSFFVGLFFGSVLFPMLAFLYVLIFISDNVGSKFPIYDHINQMKKFVPKFNIEKSEDLMHTEYMSDVSELESESDEIDND